MQSGIRPCAPCALPCRTARHHAVPAAAPAGVTQPARSGALPHATPSYGKPYGFRTADSTPVHPNHRPRRLQAVPNVAQAAEGSAVRSDLKSRLFQTVSRLNSAAIPGPQDLQQLSRIIDDLVRANPCRDTATSPLINGRWVLLYTISTSALRGAAGGGGGLLSQASQPLEGLLSPLQLANDAAYKFFYRFVPILAGSAVGVRGASQAPGGAVKARGNFQTFDTAAQRVENQARFEVGSAQCSIDVDGTAQLVQAEPGQPQQRLRATFTSFALMVDGQKRLELPLSLLKPVGFVDTPYLDEEVRISIGDKGSLFIAVRDKRQA